MARRNLSNPREGEGKGHGRDRRELRALRQKVRDLEAQVASHQMVGTEPFDFDTAMAQIDASIATLESQSSELLTQRRALAECQETLNERLPQIVQGIRYPCSSSPTLRMRLAGLLAHIGAWLLRRAPGGSR